MGIFRSEDMQLYQITIPKDDSWDVMNQLGQLNTVHFIDLNKGEQPFALPYTNQIKRCEETERRVIYILKECQNLKITINKPRSIPAFLDALQAVKSQKKKAANLLFEEIENDVIDKEKFVVEQTERLRQMNEQYMTMLDYEQVLKAVEEHLHRMRGGSIRGSVHGGAHIVDEESKDNPHYQWSINKDRQSERPDLTEDKTPLIENAMEAMEVNIAQVAGTIEADEKPRLKKLIFRATRGKALTFFQDFSVPNKEGKMRQKSVYIIVFQEGRQLRDKIVRICDSFLGQRFDLPPMMGIQRKLAELRQNINDSRALTEQSRNQLKYYLTQINQISGDDGFSKEKISALEVYKWFVAKEKTLYHSLNNMKAGASAYIGFFWSPITEEGQIREVLQQYPTTDFKRFSNHTIKPPTYIKSNEFTWAFQEIVNTYGIPMYKEVNPAVFACVSFPFLFGVMFGDMGHGTILFLAGLGLVLGNERMKGTAMEAFGQARYLIFMMGIFAIFNGLIYNECFAIPIDFFGSCYEQDPTILPGPNFGFPRKSFGCVYPMGVDPRWAQSEQVLTFTNNLKMKIAVILGVLQMALGICMKAFNNVHFGKTIDFFFEFVPQIILLLVLFGWMDFLIIMKWLRTMNLDDPSTTMQDQVHFAPAIITTMINMFLEAGSEPKASQSLLFSGQVQIAVAFVLIAFVCVPVMLLVKPLHFKFTHKEHHDVPHEVETRQQSEQVFREQPIPEKQQLLARNDQIEQIAAILAKEGAGAENHVFSEFFIHQLIETIEFVLGTISNTASYLRLWALSLAHSQLASVFLDQTLGKLAASDEAGKPTGEDVSIVNGVFMFFLFIVFFTFTFFVLMCMDTLECFLHTLRLHWVEFQNKFYKGSGYKFNPFSFETVLKEEMKRK